jgi:predicted AlkP superfamily pyrophosphatase or phosphodiesterase
VAGLALLTGCAVGDADRSDSVPRLVVLIVVDQLSQDLFDRYADLFTGGFRRMREDGRVYVQASHDHAITVTAPGHATLVTGVHPSRHGVIANSWLERVGDEWVKVYCVGDSSAPIVGQPRLRGVSPHRLVRSAVADWLVDAHRRSLVASVSAKDRAAVLAAAHARGHVYWFEPAVGRFVTSGFYAERYPAWVTRFHADVLPAYAADTVWLSAVPAAARTRSRADTAAYEADGTHTFFPHRSGAESTAFWQWFAATPMMDALTLDFARATIQETGLGADPLPDFLTVSLSAADRVGHAYGPGSREQLDTLLRLDRALGDFLAFLDSEVGSGAWTAVLTSDHGAAPEPEELRAAGDTTSRRATPSDRAALDTVVARAGRLAGDPAAGERSAAALESLDFVADAWTVEELVEDPPSDSFSVLASRSVHDDRVPERFGRIGLVARFEPWWLEHERGSTHGTPAWYDRHVPIVFLGPGVPAGLDSTRVSTVDVAPTLAGLLGIPFPEDLDGARLEGVLAKKPGAAPPPEPATAAARRSASPASERP